MLVKDGVAYLQAGGGIVWDSQPEEEWVETMNKLAANIRCIAAAEERYLGMENGGDSTLREEQAAVEEGGENGHVSLAAG